MARSNLTFADLVACARRVGVQVIEAPSSHRGKRGKMGTVVGVTLHHTGTSNSLKPAEDYLDFNVVKEGRAGLENSLSAFGIGRHRAIYVFSEFLSWHAGNWSYDGITDGNGHFLGIEAAGVGDWTPFQLEVYPRLVASLLLFIGEGTDMMPRHADGAMPRGRKNDAANLPSNFRTRVAHFMANPAQININYDTAAAVEEDDDMASIIVNKATGKAALGSIGGGWSEIPNDAGYFTLYVAAGLAKSATPFNADQAQYDHLQTLCTVAEGNDNDILARVKELQTKVDKLSAASGGVDLGAVESAVTDGVSKAIASIETTVRVAR